MPEILKGFSIDHKIPIGLIFAIMVQTAAIIWWGSGINSSIDEHARALQSLQAAEQVRIRDERELYGRMGRIETSLINMNSSLARIENKLTNDNR